DEVARLRAPSLAAGDQHLGPALAFLEHIIDAALGTEVPDERGLVPLEDIDDAAFPPAGSIGGDAHGDAIAVPQRSHLPRGQIDVVAAVVRTNEAEAVPVGEHDAGQEIQAASQAELSGPVADELAVPNHRLQPVLERAAMRIGMNAELVRQRLQRQRAAGLLHCRADLVAARDRMLVAALPVRAGGPVSWRHQDVVRRLVRAREVIGNASYNETLPARRKRLTDSKAASTFVRLPAPSRGGGTGRRAGFRCQWGKPRGGSSPLLGTTGRHRFALLAAYRSSPAGRRPSGVSTSIW